jgi:protein TonB
MKHKDTFIKNAYYEGGKKAMDEFIQKNIQYPTLALENKTEGKIHLFLDIDKKGKVIKAKLVSGIGNGCDDEAIRVVKLMQWQVDKVRNMHVVFHQRLTINFRLPSTKEQITAEIEPIPSNETANQQNITVQYTIVAEKKKDEGTTAPAPSKSDVVYSYQI